MFPVRLRLDPEKIPAVIVCEVAVNPPELIVTPPEVMFPVRLRLDPEKIPAVMFPVRLALDPEKIPAFMFPVTLTLDPEKIPAVIVCEFAVNPPELIVTPLEKVLGPPIVCVPEVLTTVSSTSRVLSALKSPPPVKPAPVLIERF